VIIIIITLIIVIVEEKNIKCKTYSSRNVVRRHLYVFQKLWLKCFCFCCMQLVIRRGACGFGFTVFGSSPVQVCRIDRGQSVC